MAKKKVSQSHDPKQSQTQPIPMAAPTDDSSSLQQIKNLKNLNAVLLKETTQSRQQIDSLQSALHRSAVTYDIQNAVVSVFVKSQVREMSLRFDTLVGETEYEVAVLTARLQNETSALARERDGLVREAKRLEESVNRERKLREEAEKLRLEGEEALSQKQRDVAELERDRDLALKSSRESVKVIEAVTREKSEIESRNDAQEKKIAALETELKQLNESLKKEKEFMRANVLQLEGNLGLALQKEEEMKMEISTLLKEKNEIQSRNNAQEQKIAALEMELKQLNESLKKEEEFMRTKVLELEGNLRLALQKEEEKKMEITALLEEKKEIEKSVETLTEEKDSVHKVLNAVQKELEDKQHELDEVVRVRSEIEEVKVNLENEIVDLRGKVDELKESCRKFEEENKQLVSQVKHYRNAVEEAVLQKESNKKLFDEKKKEVEKLELQIAGMEEAVAKSGTELGQVRSERDKLVEKEKMLEGHVSVLRKENDALQSMLVEAQKESEDLNAKVEVWCSNSNKALTLLKTTAAALVCQHKERNGGEEVVSNENHVEDIQPYTQELDAIKKAFKSKDEMVDDMKQQLASLNKSVAEAHKSKSLWTVISSATTIFAAVLAAYVARGR